MPVTEKGLCIAAWINIIQWRVSKGSVVFRLLILPRKEYNKAMMIGIRKKRVWFIVFFYNSFSWHTDALFTCVSALNDIIWQCVNRFNVSKDTANRWFKLFCCMLTIFAIFSSTRTLPFPSQLHAVFRFNVDFISYACVYLCMYFRLCNYISIYLISFILLFI